MHIMLGALLYVQLYVLNILQITSVIIEILGLVLRFSGFRKCNDVPVKCFFVKCVKH